MKTIWTVGHSTLSLEDFLARVRSVDLIVDVRRFPMSRRYPHFSQDSLSKAKPYLWLEELGGRRTGDNGRHPSLRNEAFRAYATHMETEGFRKAFEELETAAAERKVALMCAEAVWFRCHRFLLSDLLTARGWTVLHLPGERPHRLTPVARPVAGGIVYDGEPAPKGASPPPNPRNPSAPE